MLMLTSLMGHPCSQTYIISIYVRDLTNLNHYACIHIIDKPLDNTNRNYTIYVKSHYYSFSYSYSTVGSIILMK